MLKVKLKVLKVINYLIKNKKIMAAQKLQRQKCEIYSRVVGYLSPVQRWNDGKKSEFGDRKVYNKILNKI